MCIERLPGRPILRAVLLMLAACLLGALPVAPAAAYDCPGGAVVRDAAFCAFFRQYRAPGGALDDRIRTRLKLASGAETRSIALVIGISRYKMAGADLAPAKIDFDNLIGFFTADQSFDEVIALENDAATKANIDYFLDEYLVERAIPFAGKGRLIVAYTGHGILGAGPVPAALVLAGAESTSQLAYLYPLAKLKSSLQILSGAYFHVLALLNACYGGGIFDVALTGGNTTVSSVPGGHALTAGASDELVYSLGGPGQGSVFFDSLINGVRTGQADNYPQIQVDASGVATRVRLGITRLGPLVSYLTNEVENVNILRQRNDPAAKPYSAPWTGSIEPISTRAGGGFFFLSPRTAVDVSFNLPTAAPPPAPIGSPPPAGGPHSSAPGRGGAFSQRAQRPVPDALAPAGPAAPSGPVPAGRPDLPAGPTSGPVSAVPTRPDIKIFNPPDEYPFRGVDVSRFEGRIDWGTVKRVGIDFAYIRASGAGGADPVFARHWGETKGVGMPRGAYHVYSYCRPIAEQLALIGSVVPVEEAALPFGIDVEAAPAGAEAACAASKGPQDLKGDVLALARGVSERFGKVPLIYGNRLTLAKVLDERFEPYMVWLASYTNGGAPDVQLAGRNPWTLWQFTSTATVDGIGRNVDLSAFFGTADQFAAFRTGKSNVALQAALGH